MKLDCQSKCVSGGRGCGDRTKGSEGVLLQKKFGNPGKTSWRGWQGKRKVILEQETTQQVYELMKTEGLKPQETEELGN